MLARTAQFFKLMPEMPVVRPILKQSDCWNKTTCLSQTDLPKSCSLFRTTYIEDIKEFFKGLLLCSKLALHKKI